MRVLSVMLLCFVAASCTTSEEVRQRISDTYVGKPADTFFVDYGPPANQYKTDSGWSIYTWSSESDQVYIPNNTLAGGSMYNMVCQLKIVTDSNNMIKEFSITRDTLGHLDTSRCNQVLSAQKGGYTIHSSTISTNQHSSSGALAPLVQGNADGPPPGLYKCYSTLGVATGSLPMPALEFTLLEGGKYEFYGETGRYAYDPVTRTLSFVGRDFSGTYTGVTGWGHGIHVRSNGLDLGATTIALN